MRFNLTLSHTQGEIIPVNYSYPLSAAFYRIIAKGDPEYGKFLHETGYGKGFKFFTFSQIHCPFRIEGDRLHLLGNELTVQVGFHLPQAMESFIKGLFQSEKIEIADSKTKSSFVVKTVESLPDPLGSFKSHEIIHQQLVPISPIVAGVQNEKGNYDFLSPEDPRFVESIIYNWRNKISTCFDPATGSGALLLVEVISMKNPPKSRLIWIKQDKPEQTKIRGWMNFGLNVTAEKRFIDILFNAGVGVYNGQGFGCVGTLKGGGN